MGFLVACAVLSLSGCAQTQERLKDYNRDYDAYGDLSTGVVGIGGRIYPAGKPGEGRPSIGLKLEGNVNQLNGRDARSPFSESSASPAAASLPDFKSGPKATTKGIWF